MKYAEYEALAKDVTADNALDTVRAMLEKAQTDAIEYDTEIAALNDKITESDNKYKDLQVDYIKRFTSESKEEESTADEIDLDAEIEDIMKNI